MAAPSAFPGRLPGSKQLARLVQHGPPATRGESCQTHAHVAAPNLRHLEYFHDHARIETMLFDSALDPSGGVLRPGKSRLGFGLSLKEPNAASCRTA